MLAAMRPFTFVRPLTDAERQALTNVGATQ